jgi:glycyl-tRNA synthetase beta chain
MTVVKNLLVELFVEELPPKALKTLGEQFAFAIVQHLIRCQLTQERNAEWSWFASPRRLGVHVNDVLYKAPDRSQNQKLVPLSVGFNAEGKPTPALIKKLASYGLDESVIPKLTRVIDGKSETLFIEQTLPGISLSGGLKEAIDESIRKLPIPKVMSYQLADGWTSVNFVRPAHGLVALHGSDVIDVSVLGLTAGRITHGHRFEASKSDIELHNADSYAEQLEKEGAVIASFAARRAEIVRQLQTAAGKESLRPIADEALLDEVTALVERPNVLTCQFEKEFLDVPAECLILTMKANQKYFPLLDANDKLTNKFLVVSNIRPADPSRIIEGNERVVRPRLADAKFFYDQDRKQTLESRLPRLEKVVYHNKLGTQRQRVSRLEQLAFEIGKELGDLALAERAQKAALIAKADLLTDMVGEFPELQGIMGRYYALADGWEAEIAESIREHYLPRGAGDALPATPTGMVLALADKIDTLVGIFAAGQKPSGTKDPFGLRRAALGVLRILIEHKLPIDLNKLLLISGSLQPVDTGNSIVNEVYDYIMERLRGYYLEGDTGLTITTEMFDAVLENRPSSPLDFDQRLRALEKFLKLGDAQSLAAANKRINNILKKTEVAVGNEVDSEKLIEPAESILYEQLQQAEHDTAPLFAARNYQDALARLATLRAAVDQFFDSVMVMADDASIRSNRLALLSRLRRVFLQVADLSRLPG